ncbi:MULTISPECIES: tetratricopeptide repeat protein [unclassified Nitratiruptor]|uniref:tetratricopeptide repeat protein n=1 Tax=unclassified Nitratiruptor TaxID=2624044 RepID=UPI001914F781|nr:MULTISPECIES: tetratricopeptide repeat protein [unclassified Nitratiruptor]
MYHFKRFILVVLSLFLVSGGVWYFYNKTMYKEQKNIKRVTSFKPKKSKKVKKQEKYCYALQTYFGYGKSQFAINRVKKLKKTYEAKGLDCNIIQLDTQQRPILKLHCNIAPTKEELLPWLKYAKSKGIDAVIVHGDCSLAKKQSLPPSKKASKKKVVTKKQKIIENQTAENEKEALLQTKPTTLKELITTYQTRPNYTLALEIAQAFYKQKRYDKAIFWAKRANKLDRYKDDAWIVYAKALYAKGKKQKAKDILRFFLKFQDSPKIRNLLKEWS